MQEDQARTCYTLKRVSPEVQAHEEVLVVQ